MKTKQRNRLVLGIAIAMIAFLLIYYNGQKVSDFIRSVVIEAQLKKQYDEKFDVSVKSIYKFSSVKLPYATNTHPYDPNEYFYSFCATQKDTNYTIHGYTNSSCHVICTTEPVIHYSDQLKKDIDECIQKIISEDAYAKKISFEEIMYYEDLSYEDFLISRSCTYRDELDLYFTSDTTDEEIANIVALLEEKEFPFNINSYRVDADYDSDILKGKEFGYDVYYSFENGEDYYKQNLFDDYSSHSSKISLDK